MAKASEMDAVMATETDLVMAPAVVTVSVWDLGSASV
jgi:hypothetical protein